MFNGKYIIMKNSHFITFASMSFTLLLYFMGLINDLKMS